VIAVLAWELKVAPAALLESPDLLEALLEVRDEMLAERRKAELAERFEGRLRGA